MNQLRSGESPGSKMRVLVVAAAVHPDKGSEPGMGWRWISNLAKFHEIDVICFEDEGNRSAIENAIARDPSLEQNLHVHYVPWNWSKRSRIVHAVAGWVPPVYYHFYKRWHRQAIALAHLLVGQVKFDLAHQLNMIGYREPGFLGTLDLPLVWGPVGGASNPPLGLASRLGPLEFGFLAMKAFVNRLQLDNSPRVRAAIMRADVLISASSDTRGAFIRRFGRDSRIISAVGCESRAEFERAGPSSGNAPGQTLSLVWSGLHVARKALPLLFDALKKLPSHIQWKLTILGHGPLTEKWKAKAEREGINDRCCWVGWLPRNEALNLVEKADVFLLTSLHEGSPTVVFEAMERGVPIITLDHCGMTDIVTESSGVRVPIASWDQVSSSLAEAIARCYENRKWLEALSRGARMRAEELSWENLVSQMNNAYRDALARSETTSDRDS